MFQKSSARNRYQTESSFPLLPLSLLPPWKRKERKKKSLICPEKINKQRSSYRDAKTYSTYRTGSRRAWADTFSHSRARDHDTDDDGDDDGDSDDVYTGNGFLLYLLAHLPTGD